MTQVRIVAPCPKKLSSLRCLAQEDKVDDACQELRQILQLPAQKLDEHLIARTDNPMPHDSSFVPVHNAAATAAHLQASLSDSTNKIRPRSYSVGNPRNYIPIRVISLVH